MVNWSRGVGKSIPSQLKFFDTSFTRLLNRRGFFLLGYNAMGYMGWPQFVLQLTPSEVEYSCFQPPFRMDQYEYQRILPHQITVQNLYSETRQHFQVYALSSYRPVHWHQYHHIPLPRVCGTQNTRSKPDLWLDSSCEIYRWGCILFLIVSSVSLWGLWD